MGTSAELIRATLPFAREARATSWWLLIQALGLQALAMVATLLAPLALKPLGAMLIALLMLRLFMFVHDAEHGAIFRGAPAARALVWLVGLYTLNAPPVWRELHNRHHRTNAEPMQLPLDDYRIGDLLNRTVTTEQWARLGRRDRLRLRAVVHPVVFVCGLPAFVFGQGLVPFLRDPRKGWSGLLAVAVWGAMLIGLVRTLGVSDTMWVLVLPNALGSALGTYLFYAQHHFPEARIRAADGPDHLVHAALHASSFFEMPAWLHWFTGNIGYHHVHHVNAQIPFYNLPAAMEALPALQSPGRTSWRPLDIVACLRANVWDPEHGRLVSFAAADALARAGDHSRFS